MCQNIADSKPNNHRSTGTQGKGGGGFVGCCGTSEKFHEHIAVCTYPPESQKHCFSVAKRRDDSFRGFIKGYDAIAGAGPVGVEQRVNTSVALWFHDNGDGNLREYSS